MPAIGADAGLYEGSALPPQRRDAEGVRARFYQDVVEDKARSKEEGRPLYRDVDFVEVQVVGDKTATVRRPANDADKRRFPQEWALYKQGDAEQLVGTPLKLWPHPQMTKATVEELAYHKIRTVEQLAEVSDGNLQNVGPIRALRKAAQDYVAAAKGQAPAVKLRAELDEKDKQIAALEMRLQQLEAAKDKKAKQ